MSGEEGSIDLLDTLSMFEGPLTRYVGKRVSNAGPEIFAWTWRTGQQPTTWDLCLSCAQQAQRHPERSAQTYPPRGDEEPIGNLIYRGEETHPLYDEEESYCHFCGYRLSDE